MENTIKKQYLGNGNHTYNISNVNRQQADKKFTNICLTSRKTQRCHRLFQGDILAIMPSAFVSLRAVIIRLHFHGWYMLRNAFGICMDAIGHHLQTVLFDPKCQWYLYGHRAARARAQVTDLLIRNFIQNAI